MRRTDEHVESARGRMAPVWWVLAVDTWRLAWREVMTRVELALLIVLALISGVAAIGSPTAGDGAIQMLAVCLQVVPFALVLVAGQIWRRREDEVAIFARSVPADSYVAGRATGLFLVGLAMLAVVDVVASLALAGLAALPLGASLAWDTAFSAVAVVPSLLVVIGAALLLIALTGGGSRYYAPAILVALVVAFVEYKIPSLAATGGASWVLWSPFPGLLTLGLALPPSLTPAVPGWLWLNRGFWAAAGLVLMMGTAWWRGRGRETPLGAARPLAIMTGAGLLGMVGCGTGLVATTSWWAPPVMPAAVVAAVANGVARVSPGATLVLNVTASPSGSVLGGTATLETGGHFARPGGDLAFWLNGGFNITAVLVNGQPVAFSRLGGAAVGAGTAAALWRVVGSVPPEATVQISYYGPLLPAYTWIPAPPFQRGVAYEGAYVNPTHLFLDGNGTWYPRFLAREAGGRPLYVRVHLNLALEGAMPPTVLHALTVRGFQATSPGAGALPAVIWLAGPYRKTGVAGIPVFTAHHLSPQRVGAYAPYAAALRAVVPWLPARARGPLAIARSPLLVHPLLSHGTLVAPENQPYCIPPDPVTGNCQGPSPTPLSALMRVAWLGWLDGLGLPDANLPPLTPVFGEHDQREGLAAPLAVATAWRAAAGPTRALIRAAWESGRPLPVVGALNAVQRRQAAMLVGALGAVSPAAWRRFADNVEDLANRPDLTWAEVAAVLGGIR
jgi:hypothetical protein